MYVHIWVLLFDGTVLCPETHEKRIYSYPESYADFLTRLLLFFGLPLAGGFNNILEWEQFLLI